MRNGDYTPSRLDAQYDAAVLLCDAKIEDNRESTVGMLTMGGKRCVPPFANMQRDVLAKRVAECLRV
jgi:hypothetical protein